MKNYSIKTAIYSLFILILFSQCSQRSESASEVATEAVSMDMVAATKEEAAPPTNQPNPVPTKTCRHCHSTHAYQRRHACAGKRLM
jgi:cytochrome c5